MTILNYTYRDLRFVLPDNLVALLNGKYTIEKEGDLLPFITLPRQKEPLNCRVRKDMIGHAGGIPVYNEVVTGVDPVPEGAGDCMLIVTRQYAEACRKFCLSTKRLLVVTGPVFVAGKSLPSACVSLGTVEPCLYYEMPDFFRNTAEDIFNARQNLSQGE